MFICIYLNHENLKKFHCTKIKGLIQYIYIMKLSKKLETVSRGRNFLNSLQMEEENPP